MQIDAVAKSRDGKFRMVSNDEREQTLNQLLTVRFNQFCFQNIVEYEHIFHVNYCIAGDGRF